jgi:AraC family transcriptional regulator of adaptative response / DNA-3-methyladenine glycosylase II
MNLSRENCEKAMRSKDPLFDGRFFIGVKTTGIFCRPICPARSPKLSNVVFYKSAAAATDAGLRPCLRCRPECTPGTAAWMGSSSRIHRALKLINGEIESNCKSSMLAKNLGISDRHLRRLFHEHLGASPSSVISTEKLLFAKRLITETNLSMADIAFASGYNSVRSFNHHIKRHYSCPPLKLRRHKTVKSTKTTLKLAYQPPLNFKKMMAFLKFRAIPGVEAVEDNTYSRTIELKENQGVICVSFQDTQNMAILEIDFPDSTKLFHITQRVKAMFDLNTSSLCIDGALKQGQTLSHMVEDNPGLRVPGSMNSFELGIRAIIGQQISVKGASTIIGRLAQKYGKKLNCENKFNLEHIFPGPGILANALLDGIGLTNTRIDTIHRFSRAVHNKDIVFNPWSDPDDLKKSLVKLKGIGDWTAQYIAMRTIKDPDAFPHTDLGLLKAHNLDTSASSKKEFKAISENWKPYRAYAAMYLWNSL